MPRSNRSIGPRSFRAARRPNRRPDRRTRSVEMLEHRTLLSVTPSLVGGGGTEVIFDGTNSSDKLFLRDGTNDYLEFSTDGTNFSNDLGGGSKIKVSAITKLEIDMRNGNDTVDLSDLDGLLVTVTAQVTGGAGNDTYASGPADVDFLYTGGGNGEDSFSANGTGTSTIKADADGTVIGLNGTGSGFVNGVDIIDDDGHSNVKVIGTNSSDTLDFSQVQFNSDFVIDGLNGNDSITTSNKSEGRYRGNAGKDSFTLGSENTTLLYSGGNNGDDSFTGNTPNDEIIHTILAEADDTVIGLDGRGAGFVNGVDVINDGGFDNVKVIGTNSHDTLDFSKVTFNSNFEIDGRKGNDTITTSDESAGEYRGSQDNDTFILGAKKHHAPLLRRQQRLRFLRR